MISGGNRAWQSVSLSAGAALDRLSDRIAACRNWLFLAALLLLAAALPTAGRLTFDQTIESFFAPQHPDIQLLKRTREVFGGDEFVIVAWRQEGLLTSEDGEEPVEVAAGAGEVIRSLADHLSALPGVDGGRTRDLQRLLAQSPRNRNTRRAMLKLFEGLLVSADRQTTAIVLQLEPAVRSAVPRHLAIEGIRRAAESIRPGCAVAGEPVQIQEMFDLVERDGNVLYGASLLVLSGMLLWIFRGLRWVAASLLVVLGAVATTRAVLVLAGTQLSMVSSMLNSLVTVIAISTTTHITVHYRELRVQDGLTAEQSLRRTFAELATPVFWTVVTVAAGFAALLVSEIVPVRSFAIMMTLGTLMVPLLILLVLPAAFASGKVVPVPGRVGLEDRLDRWLERMARAIDLHPLATSAVCVLLTVITLPGLLVLQVETDFSRNFRDSSPMIQALRFVESELGPAGTWDVSFNVPEPLTAGFLDRVDELSGRLRDLQERGLQVEVVSLSDALNIPPRLGTSLRRLELIQRRQPDLVNGFYNREQQRMRIVLRSPEQQATAEKLEQIAEVRSVAAQFFEDLETESREQQSAGGAEATGWRAEAAAGGLFVVMARIIDSLLADQLKSFLWASVGTVLCTAVAFRSLRIGLISLVPNVFPIGIVTGTLGLLHVPVNIGTAMIASVAMGFTCSVYYIDMFQRSLPSLGVTGALQRAQAGVGKAVVLAHGALVAGFLVLTLSEFIPLVYFGGLLSLSMLGGLVSDLVMLPLLLRWTTPAQPDDTAGADGVRGE
ncbi:MAG: efflux RND transporter permease subunit [Planctomyces sp.]